MRVDNSYGTLSACYSKDHLTRSGSGAKGTFTVDKDNSVVRFSYHFVEHQVNIEIFNWDETLQDYVSCVETLQ